MAGINSDPATLALAVKGGLIAVVQGDDPAEGGVRLHLGRMPQGARPRYMGVSVGGVNYVSYDGGEQPPSGARWAELRRVGHLLGDLDTGLAAMSVALANWHAAARYCGRCGGLTDSAAAGWERVCRVCGEQHFPRTDPAVIGLVIDERGRALMAHNPRYGEKLYTAVAGFAEAGECAEAAMRREILEEVGLRIGRLEYLGSQPWPFPRSLMLGYFAYLAEDESPGNLSVDGEEILDALWVEPGQLDDLVKRGDLVLPGRSSIAHAIISAWQKGEHGLGEASG